MNHSLLQESQFLQNALQRILQEFSLARANNKFSNDGTREGWTRNVQAPRSLMVAILHLTQLLHNNITHILDIVP